MQPITLANRALFAVAIVCAASLAETAHTGPLEPDAILPTEAGGTEITRFNALKHGILSRYTVLPWEDADENRAPVMALATEHSPRGPTEEHLVEELAGIL